MATPKGSLTVARQVDVVPFSDPLVYCFHKRKEASKLPTGKASGIGYARIDVSSHTTVKEKPLWRGARFNTAMITCGGKAAFSNATFASRASTSMLRRKDVVLIHASSSSSVEIRYSFKVIAPGEGDMVTEGVCDGVLEKEGVKLPVRVMLPVKEGVRVTVTDPVVV
jgi:hypothetical protein